MMLLKKLFTLVLNRLACLYRPIVGIDVSADFSVVAILAPDGEVLIMVLLQQPNG
ncbi:hypothetical protein [Clostridium pasteurianum]|uniref:hypothetical protein n=1 Tax=Clostridium pasteurianum TaxID=1501 RepID=UPI0015C30E73|nr:hypothetical protein [Clostridium pasteurianum]